MNLPSGKWILALGTGLAVRRSSLRKLMLGTMSIRWLWAVAVLALLVSTTVLLNTGPASAGHTLFIVDDDGKAEVGNCNSKTAADDDKIQDVIDVASPGDHVFVCPGTYFEDVDVNVPGLFLLGISNGNKRPVIDGGGDNVHPNGVVNITVDGVTLDNFIIQNASAASFPTPGIGVISDNNTITNNVVIGNRCGINLWDAEGAESDGANNNFVAHNTFFNNTSDGIRLQDGSSGNTIYHNNTYNNDSDGIELRSGAANNHIIGNNAHHNPSDGIKLKSGASPATGAGAGNTL